MFRGGRRRGHLSCCAVMGDGGTVAVIEGGGKKERRWIWASQISDFSNDKN